MMSVENPLPFAHINAAQKGSHRRAGDAHGAKHQSDLKLNVLAQRGSRPSHRRADERLTHIGVPMLGLVQNIKVSSKWTFSPGKDPKSSRRRADERLAHIGVPMMQIVQNIKVSSK